ncbi:MAG: signal recognition particle-docking protein FtsY [Syntrophales bacterium]|nr:signal recognition particle-docking protein FtsY [Syntrophales bacterium]
MRRWFKRKKEEEPRPESTSPLLPEEEKAGESEAQISSPEADFLNQETPEVPPAEVVPDQLPESPETETGAPETEVAAEPPPEPPAASGERRPGIFRRLFYGEEEEEAPPPSEPTDHQIEAEPLPEQSITPLPEAEPILETGESPDAGMPYPPEESPIEAIPPESEHIQPPEEALEAGEPPVSEEAPEPRRGIFKRFRERLSRSREALAGGLDRVFLGRREVDAEALEELEEILITADLGMDTTLHLVQALEERLKRRELADVEKLKAALAEEMLALLQSPSVPAVTARPRVVLVVGVNGVGKTTTIAKLAHQERLKGRTPLLIAGDTFRAAAVEQLEIWGERIGAAVIRQKTGADPAAVVFDGLAAALARDVDTVFTDTAGRLHTKVNLMEELKKIYRTTSKKLPGAPHEVFLVLDATTGQNALSQARLFHEAVGITGLILTKMDGTAKGGVALAVAHETGLPLRYLGLGEGLEDLRPFDAEAFVAAILG